MREASSNCVSGVSGDHVNKVGDGRISEVSSGRMNEVSGARSLKAVAIVIALVLAVPCCNAVVNAVRPKAEGAASTAGLDAQAIVGSGDPNAALDMIEAVAEADSAAVPEGFDDEIGIPPGARDIRANGDGSVVGYLVDGASEGVFDQLSAQMTLRGWTAVSFGEEGTATFVKDGGRYSWALATCTQSGSATSVVIRSVAT